MFGTSHMWDNCSSHSSLLLEDKWPFRTRWHICRTDIPSLTSRLCTAFCDLLKDFCKSWRSASEVWTWDWSSDTWKHTKESACVEFCTHHIHVSVSVWVWGHCCVLTLIVVISPVCVCGWFVYLVLSPAPPSLPAVDSLPLAVQTPVQHITSLLCCKVVCLMGASGQTQKAKQNLLKLKKKMSLLDNLVEWSSWISVVIYKK